MPEPSEQLPQLTLKELRKLVEELKDAPDTLPVYVTLPTTSYLNDGEEQLDCFVSRQASWIAWEPQLDEYDDVDGSIEIRLNDPEWLRDIYGEDYEAEDLDA